MMRPFRLTLAILISTALVGFQAAPGPYILCAEICPVADGSGEVIEVICWSGPTGTGCAVETAGSACNPCEPLGSINDFGCCVADAICPVAQTCPDAGDCPVEGGDCFYCLPGRVLATGTIQSTSLDHDNSDFQSSATIQLADGDSAIRSTHSHSPPQPLFASAGHDVCIEICLLLI